MARVQMHDTEKRRTANPVITEDVANIIAMVEEETGDAALAKNIYINPTALTQIKRVLSAGGIIVTDTTIVLNEIDRSLLEGTSVDLECFIDTPQVVSLAEAKFVTRAEMAMDYALSLPGPKLVVVGSAPAALASIIAHRKKEPLSDVCVLAAPSGFASAVQLKERLKELDMSMIIVRGKKGGAAQTAAILNSILRYIKTR